MMCCPTNRTSPRILQFASNVRWIAFLQALSITLFPLALFSLALPSPTLWADETSQVISGSELPSIPNVIGVAGAYAGAIGDSLIVAGGANFPEQPPWEGGTKVWHDAIYRLDAGDAQWRQVGTLPKPAAYGITIPIENGLLLIGGCDAQQHFREVWRLSLDGEEVHCEPFAELPLALAYHCGAISKNKIYLAGGTPSPDATKASDTFLIADLGATPVVWQPFDAWQGEPVMLAAAAVQDGAFWVIGGVSLAPDSNGKPVRTYRREVRCYRESTGWSDRAALPEARAASPSPAPAIGPATLWLLGGDDGTQVARAPTEHQGFSNRVLAYHTITDVWYDAGETPAPHVTTPTVAWRGAWVIPSGEIRPGVRSPQVWSVAVSSHRTQFSALDYAALTLYLIGVLAMGSWFARRNRTTDDFFRGGGRVPWWAAGISIFATMLSSITFMAIPAQSFANGWNLFLGNSYLILAPLVIWAYLPFFRRLNVTSAYEYLELRFDATVRRMASLLFIAFQLGRTAVVLYLPALALSTATSIDVRSCIVAMGLLVVVYSVLGGVEGVIWTDVVQGIVLMFGAIAALVTLVRSIDGGVAEIVATSHHSSHLFETLRWDTDLTVGTVWVIVVGSIFANLFSYTASQDVVQRYVTTKDERSAARAIWTGFLIAPLAQAVFFAIGTGLFVFYRIHPERLDPTRPVDGVFPQFIVDELPVGVAGLIVAGIFAAAQSTLSSSLNSIATAFVTDFYLPHRPRSTDREQLRIARAVTIAVGLVGTATAVAFTTFEIRSIWETFLGTIGLLGGTIAAFFVLGIFDQRATSRGVLLGAMVGAIVVAGLKFGTSAHFFLYPIAGVLTGTVVGAISSRLLPRDSRDLSGLTMATLKEPSSAD